MKILITVGCWLLAVGLLAQAPGQLTVTINNIKFVEGELYVAIYNDEDTYMDIDRTAFREIIPVSAETESIIFTNVPDGEYAIAVFQDLNGNGELDKKGMGLPKEPFGFSNDARGKAGPPKYEKAKFSFSGDMNISIKLVSNAKE